MRQLLEEKRRKKKFVRIFICDMLFMHVMYMFKNKKKKPQKTKKKQQKTNKQTNKKTKNKTKPKETKNFFDFPNRNRTNTSKTHFEIRW